MAPDEVEAAGSYGLLVIKSNQCLNYASIRSKSVFGQEELQVVMVGVCRLAGERPGSTGGGSDIDLTKKRTTAAPLHPMVRRIRGLFAN